MSKQLHADAMGISGMSAFLEWNGSTIKHERRPATGMHYKHARERTRRVKSHTLSAFRFKYRSSRLVNYVPLNYISSTKPGRFHI